MGNGTDKSCTLGEHIMDRRNKTGLILSHLSAVPLSLTQAAPWGCQQALWEGTWALRSQGMAVTTRLSLAML